MINITFANANTLLQFLSYLVYFAGFCHSFPYLVIFFYIFYILQQFFMFAILEKNIIIYIDTLNSILTSTYEVFFSLISSLNLLIILGAFVFQLKQTPRFMLSNGVFINKNIYFVFLAHCFYTDSLYFCLSASNII